MPFEKYTLMHAEAKLSNEDRAHLEDLLNLLGHLQMLTKLR